METRGVGEMETINKNKMAIVRLKNTISEMFKNHWVGLTTDWKLKKSQYT